MEKIKEVRKSWNKFMLKKNSIDRLMTDKVDDYILIQEQPLPILIKDTCGMGGDRILYVGNFNLDNEHKFFHEWAEIISLLSAKIINMELLEVRRKELFDKGSIAMLSEGKWVLEFLWTDKWLKNKLCKLLKDTLLKQQSYILVNDKRVIKKWKNCSYRFFRKNITKELLIQICWLIYFYNFDSQKKSLRFVVEKMGMKQLEETYIPFWLQNLGGLTWTSGDAQAENTDSYLQELENSEPQRSKEKKDMLTTKEV